jgi:hypothetical protein
MFLVNSRYPLVTATLTSSERKARHQQRHTFSRSYGVNLPSSLTRVLSSALGYSPCLPVLVCGTVGLNTRPAAFLGSMESLSSASTRSFRLSSPLGVKKFRLSLGVLELPPTGLNRDHLPVELSFSVPAGFNIYKPVQEY